MTTEETVKAPGFQAPDYLGRTVDLGDYAGLRHVVLVFNRGFF
jgi:peroxiredoxin